MQAAAKKRPTQPLAHVCKVLPPMQQAPGWLAVRRLRHQRRQEQRAVDWRHLPRRPVMTV
jgi:hypothetical protein